MKGCSKNIVCDKKFASKWLLGKHMKIAHTTSAQNFKCEPCEKSFSTNLALQYHEKTIHGENEKLNECDSCGKKFITELRLLKKSYSKSA